MTWNPYRIIRRMLRDPEYYQAVTYSFAVVLAVALLAVGPIVWGAGR